MWDALEEFSTFSFLKNAESAKDCIENRKHKNGEAHKTWGIMTYDRFMGKNQVFG
jgi:hypothetical protein